YFKKYPKQVIKIIAMLKADSSLYVRKAVANCLNDISRDNPEVALETALKWQQGKSSDRKATDWIIRHGCRSLLKQGNPKAFGLFGFTYPAQVEVIRFRIAAKQLSIGDDLNFEMDLESKAKESEKLAIDYRIHYARENGRNTRKLFKLAERKLLTGKTIKVAGKKSMADISTRKHYPGKHRIEVIVNGTVVVNETFNLK
ncbi:MAG: DNA alkylation repair protein, partial [candidate division Zixibacteria bacterium]